MAKQIYTCTVCREMYALFFKTILDFLSLGKKTYLNPPPKKKTTKEPKKTKKAKKKTQKTCSNQ